MKKVGSVGTEVGVLSIAMGILLAIAAGLVISLLAEDAPPFLGFTRRYGLGIPIAVVAGLNLGAGVLLLLRRSEICVAACMGAVCAITLVYLAIMILSGAGVGINYITGLMILIPVLVVVRGRKAMDEIRTPVGSVTRPPITEVSPFSSAPHQMRAVQEEAPNARDADDA